MNAQLAAAQRAYDNASPPDEDDAVWTRFDALDSRTQAELLMEFIERDTDLTIRFHSWVSGRREVRS